MTCHGYFVSLSTKQNCGFFCGLQTASNLIMSYHYSRDHFLDSKMKEAFQCDSLSLFLWFPLNGTKSSIASSSKSKKKDYWGQEQGWMLHHFSPLFSAQEEANPTSQILLPDTWPKVSFTPGQQCSGTPGWESNSRSFAAALHLFHPWESNSRSFAEVFYLFHPLHPVPPLVLDSCGEMLLLLSTHGYVWEIENA